MCIIVWSIQHILPPYPPQRLIVHNRHGRVVRVTGNRIHHHTQRNTTALAVLIVMAFGVCVCALVHSGNMTFADDSL